MGRLLTTDEIERRRTIVVAVRARGGTKAEAAAEIGIGVHSLDNFMMRHGRDLRWKPSKVPADYPGIAEHRRR
ncbi:hypothetical protein [Acidiphilium sp.]|uniref:hypothetical protein n=1 Tax=Acidiphilium sp. TaxID=527 RepID=UPI002584B28A|nr:hypothetical protein [Acidiphilium sp.]